MLINLFLFIPFFLRLINYLIVTKFLSGIYNSYLLQNKFSTVILYIFLYTPPRFIISTILSIIRQYIILPSLLRILNYFFDFDIYLSMTKELRELPSNRLIYKRLRKAGDKKYLLLEDVHFEYTQRQNRRALKNSREEIERTQYISALKDYIRHKKNNKKKISPLRKKKLKLKKSLLLRSRNRYRNSIE